MAAIQAQAITPLPSCFTDEVVLIGSWAFPICLHSRSWSHLSAGPELCRLFQVFLSAKLLSGHPVFVANERFASCSVASVFLFMKSSADRGPLTNPHPPPEYGILLNYGENTSSSRWSSFVCQSRLLNSPVFSFFFLMFQPVGYGKPKVCPLTLTVVFFFLSGIMVSLTLFLMLNIKNTHQSVYMVIPKRSKKGPIIKLEMEALTTCELFD